MISDESILSVVQDIFSGYSFRSKIDPAPGSPVRVLQVKDLEDHYTSIGTNLTPICADGIHAKFFLREGDVLFLAKGSNNFAAAYTSVYPHVVAASAFFILRPDLTRIHPGYLAWYLNQTPIQLYLKARAAGKYCTNITKDVVQKIVLPVPPLERQQTVVSIDTLRKRENALQREMMVRRNELIAAQLLNSIKSLPRE